MKRVVITGATSMIGIALIEECILNDVEVLAIVRRNSKNISRIPQSSLVKVIECDLDKLTELDMKEEYDVFYHLAWDYTAKITRNSSDHQVRNINYTLDAVDLAKRLSCKKFIGAGSQAEYGIKAEKITPDTAIDPVMAYGVAKYTACKLSNIKCNDLKIEHIWGRIFSVYGIYDNEGTLIKTTIESLLKGEKISCTKLEQQWDYLYAKDAGYAFYLLGKKGKTDKVYCVGSGKAEKLSKYIETIQHIIGGNGTVGIGEREYAKDQVMYLCADISSLTEDTGFRPRYSFEHGIKEIIEWHDEARSS